MNMRALIVAGATAGFLIALLCDFIQLLYGGGALWAYTIAISVLGVWIYRRIDGAVRPREAVIVGAAGGMLSAAINVFIGAVVLGRPTATLFEDLLPEKGYVVQSDPSISLAAFVAIASIAAFVGALGGSIGGVFLGERAG